MKFRPAGGAPPQLLADLSQHPLTDASELARLTGQPCSTIYDALNALFDAGLAGRVRHGTSYLPASFRYYPTLRGIVAASAALRSSPSRYVHSYPISREWMRILIGRMDAVGSIYRLAATMSPGTGGLRTCVAFHRKGAVDATITLHDGKRFGVARQGRALARRSLHARLMRIWKNHDSADSLLILAPSPWEGVITANWASDHGFPYGYVAAESVDALTRRDIDAWHRISSVIGGTCTLSEVVAETTVYGGFPAGSPSRKRASLPDPARMMEEAPTFGMSPAEKRTLAIITAHPMISRDHLVRWLSVSESRISQILRSLHDLIERHGRRRAYRYTLSAAGIGYITYRDRAELSTTQGTWSTEPRSVPTRGRLHVGHLIDTWATRMAHTDGITWWLSRLAAEAKADPASELLWWVPEAWSERKYHWNERAIHPDAVGEVVMSSIRIDFFLEYERWARYPRGVARRLERYVDYYHADETSGDLPSLPLCLFVVDHEAVAETYVETARQSQLLQLPILVSSMPELAEQGILGRSWHPLWAPGSQPMRLSDLAGYRWDRLNRRMERRP